MVLRMVMDSLRYWVEVMHVDGFRFDLCTALGRRVRGGFDRSASFFDAIRQDPVLTRVKLIAEPWDIGPGGYQVGGFPPPFLEWNDKYRDGIPPLLARRCAAGARACRPHGRLGPAVRPFRPARHLVGELPDRA